jgi:hypothetical protein
LYFVIRACVFFLDSVFDCVTQHTTGERKQLKALRVTLLQTDGLPNAGCVRASQNVVNTMKLFLRMIRRNVVKACGEAEVYFHALLTSTALVGALRLGRFGACSVGGCMDRRAGLEDSEEINIPLQEMEPLSFWYLSRTD